MERLEQASHKLSSKLYEQTQPGGPQGGPQAGADQPGAESTPAGGSEADDVVDAEFEVQDEKKD